MRPMALLALLLLAATPIVRSQDLKADTKTGRGLLAEGDDLADKGETTEAQLRYKQAFEQILPGMRKLGFRTEVKRDVTPREDLKAVLLKELDEDKPAAEFRADEQGMKALGLLPRDTDYKEIMVQVYSEEVAAFYDPKTKTMHLIREPKGEKVRPVGFLESLLGKKKGFDKEENKTVIAHELTHALADQNYNLDAMQDKIQHDDDRSLALSALIEGEATLTMMAAQMNDWDGTKIVKVQSASLDRMFGIMGPMMLGGTGETLKKAPPILAETLIFPYIRGLVFCAKLVNDGGWTAISRAYEAPPVSTEQILHPEKYGARLDMPTSIDLGSLEAGSGWRELGRNTLGEMQMAVLLRDHDGKKAAMGWDGDRYATFEAPDGRLGLVWLTTWDSEEDARQFARNYQDFQTTKLGPHVPKPDAHPDHTRRPREGAIFAVERRGGDVAIVEGFETPLTESLIDRLFLAKKTEMTLSPR